MGFAVDSLPKTNVEEHEGIVFCGSSEGVGQAIASSAGKVLLLSDDLSLSEFALSPRVLSIVYDGDALPLFAMPDGVSRVVAAGKRDVLLAARYFAEIRQTACTLLPSEASLDGVFEERGEIVLGGERVCVPLSAAQTLCDPVRLSASLGEGFSRLLLTRLAFYEAAALSEFGICRRAVSCELPADAEGIVLENARVRRAERETYRGEGVLLAAALGGEHPAWDAYLLLSALYTSFFEKGRPRRYYTPDYRARARRAGVGTGELVLPTRQEYAERALVLERIRARFSKEFRTLLDGKEEFRARIATVCGAAVPPFCGGSETLRLLPELSRDGLSAIVRDFGLLE